MGFVGRNQNVKDLAEGFSPPRVVWHMSTPNIGGLTALPWKGSAEKPWFLSDRIQLSNADGWTCEFKVEG